MTENSNVFALRQLGAVDDPLTDILRSEARRLLVQVVELEAETFLDSMKELKLADGRDRVVRHGHGPERTIQTGIGPVEVRRAKLRNRGAASDGERIPVQLGDSPAVGPTDQEPRCSVAGAVPAGHLDGRFPGGADRPSK